MLSIPVAYINPHSADYFNPFKSPYLASVAFSRPERRLLQFSVTKSRY